MTHINSLFPSKYVAASDLQGQEVQVQINRITVEGVGKDEEDRPILYFAGMSKGMVLNRTNAKRITKLYGTDTNDWIGKWITIYESETDFGGETVPCIRVREKVTGAGVAINGNHEPSPARKLSQEQSAEYDSMEAELRAKLAALEEQKKQPSQTTTQPINPVAQLQQSPAGAGPRF